MKPKQSGSASASDRQTEEAAIFARANELLAGSHLRFGEQEMRRALAAFVSFLKVSERFQADEAEYLRKNEVSSILRGA